MMLNFILLPEDLEVWFLALSIAFGRITIKCQSEKFASAFAQALLLGGVAWWAFEGGYDTLKLAVLLGCECLSYLRLSCGWPMVQTLLFATCTVTATLRSDQAKLMFALLVALIVYQGGLSISVAVAAGAAFWPLVFKILPFEEINAAYFALDSVFAQSHKSEFAARCICLVITAIHIQLGVGQLGVAYLRASQRRKNALLTEVATGSMKASSFAKRMVLPFVLTVAIPYLGQRVAVEACYELVFQRFAFRAQRALRLESVPPSQLTALLSTTSSTKALTLDAYGSAVEATAKRVYDLGSRKLFSLPKIALLPSLAVQHPAVFLWSLPACLAVDAVKARLIAALTRRVEKAKRDATQAKSERSRIEAHDTAQAEVLVSSPGATDFEVSRWLDLARSVETPAYQATILETCRRYVRWLYWSDFLTPAIEVALATMLELRMIEAADVWVLARALEDTLDLVLTKSRAEAELAALGTDVERIHDLKGRLENATTAAQQFGILNVTCSIQQDTSLGSETQLSVTDLRYDRGAAKASANLVATPGEVLLISGPNGAGKSTFFALLKTCTGGPPPQGLQEASGHIVLPPIPSSSLYPSGIAHVAQRPYCPVAASPSAWINSLSHSESKKNNTLAAAVLMELDFFHGSRDSTAISNWLEDNHDHRDFCSELSGGQAVKLELSRQILIPVRAGAQCPSLLLLDETFAPLDPRSKDILQSSLRSTCPKTAVLTIYHGENGTPQEKETKSTCTEGGGFFTDVLSFRPPPASSSSSDEDPRFHLERVGLCSPQ